MNNENNTGIDKNNKQRSSNKIAKILIELNDFAEINNIKKPKHTKVKVAIYCNTCKRKHHLHFGEFKNGSANAKNLQDIIDKYSWKYCNRDRNNNKGFQITEIPNFDNTKNDKNIINFISILKNIRGFKIVTITVGEYTKAFDINEDFKFSDIMSEYLFYKILKRGFLKSAGIIVRQILKIKVKRNIKNKEIWIPKKKLYGFILNSNNIFSIPKEELEICCNTDNVTGLPLEPEKDVIYEEFKI